MNNHTVSKFIAGREDFGKILSEVNKDIWSLLSYPLGMGTGILNAIQWFSLMLGHHWDYFRPREWMVVPTMETATLLAK